MKSAKNLYPFCKVLDNNFTHFVEFWLRKSSMFVLILKRNWKKPNITISLVSSVRINHQENWKWAISIDGIWWSYCPTRIGRLKCLYFLSKAKFKVELLEGSLNFFSFYSPIRKSYVGYILDTGIITWEKFWRLKEFCKRSYPEWLIFSVLLKVSFPSNINILT